ncbi:SUMF1/EgtB/PvdO family nonheme iron enzyme [Ideonella sp. YS5]|uniref:SUMF1/EgtB/PvdO family nonheme iron enzyme n=1 Tax=Ideonella sp. YS5 TaxID=3453714 RepID=UPI003EEB9AC1
MTTDLESPTTAARLSDSLGAARERTLAMFDRLQAALGGPTALPRYLPELSPPLWDLGHLAWAESFWIGRNPGLMAGDGRNVSTARAASPWLPHADAWYDDRRVSHSARWHQPLPSARATADYARRTREHSLALLPAAARRPPALALFVRALDAEEQLHEDWLVLAQTLGLDLAEFADVPAPAGDGRSEAGLDTAPLTWSRFLPFVEAGGYEQRDHWSTEGWEWRRRQSLTRPRHLAAAEPEGEPLRHARFGRWIPLDLNEPAMHLSFHEADAWCRWAGRRLPTEAEWRAAQAARPDFAWGQVWEWALDEDGAPLLVGASFATSPRQRETPGQRPQAADRNEGFQGFRSAAA